MANNILQSRLEPEKPKIISQERIYVYVPKATQNKAGIASYDPNYFRVNNESQVTLKPNTLTLLDNFNSDDFEIKNEQVSIKWPHAYNNVEGLIKIKQDSYLQFVNNELDVDINKFNDLYVTIEDYNTNNTRINNKFSDLDNKISNVNIAVNERVKITDYNARFGNWDNKPEGVTTVRSWFNKLEGQDESLEEIIKTLHSVLGVFETPAALQNAYPASQELLGITAFVLSTETYWAVRYNNNQYEWYDTQQTSDIAGFMEIDASAYRADGIASAGTTRKWAQSDHRHPTDESRLAKSIYQSTNVGIVSQFNNNSVTDFKFDLWEEEAGTYLPNRQVNIPYVRKSKALHNWQGSNFIFTDSDTNEEYYWAGTSSQFEIEKYQIKNNSLIIIDDDENSGDQEVDLINRRMLEAQGVTIDFDEPTEQIVTIANTTMIGKVLTLEEVNTLKGTRYRLKPINLGTIDDTLIVHSYTNGTTDTIKAKYITNDKILVGGANGQITEGISQSIIVKASDILTNGSILIGGNDNFIRSIGTGATEGINLVTDGNGALHTKTYIAGRMIYTNNMGILTEFPTSAADEGKVFGVDVNGQPTLLTIHTIPDSLPVTTVTAAPSTSNINGMIVCKLNSDPGTYVDGVLYMW